MAGKIFVNYRRDDSAPHALSIAQYLERGFGARNVFIDVDRIRSGENFTTVLESRLAMCSVLLAVIGPKWLEARDEAGNRRLDDPHDWVRTEIVRALRRGIKVIPVLIAGASLPPRDALPDDLKPLLGNQAAIVSTNNFRHEMAGLASDIRTVVGPDRSRLVIAGLAAVGVLALGWIIYQFGLRSVPTQVTLASFEAQLNSQCRSDLESWRSKSAIGAFAVASNGGCGFISASTKLSTARAAAIEACKKQGSDCRIAEVTEGDWTLNKDCEAQFGKWKNELPAKAFAVARSGHCGSASGKVKIDDARSEATLQCERAAGDCRVQDADPGNWAMRDGCDKDLQEWRAKGAARAFAVARNGECASSWDYEDADAARKAALTECEALGSECKITETYEGNWELNEECKADAVNWTKLRGRGSFAVGRSGACGWSYSWGSSSQADSRALEECQKQKGVDCKIIARK
jgi:TIR domain/Domain of unknown function (DUF4189)